MNAADLRRLALALPGTVEVPHMDRAAFRTSRRIFATLAPDGLSANVALDPEGQALMTASRPQAFAPINNAWGRQGWTTVTLSAVDEGALGDALSMAHALAAPAPKKGALKKAPLKPAAKKTPTKKKPTKKKPTKKTPTKKKSTKKTSTKTTP